MTATRLDSPKTYNPSRVLRTSVVLAAATLALALLPACGGGQGSGRPGYCAGAATHPLRQPSAALAESVRVVHRFGLRPRYLAPRSFGSAVGSLVPGPAPGLTGIATNACSTQIGRTGVVVFMSFRTPREATAWMEGPATRWHDAVDRAGIPQDASDAQRGMVLGSSCWIVGVYENLVSPVPVSGEFGTLPRGSDEDLLSDPSVGRRVLPPLFGC